MLYIYQSKQRKETEDTDFQTHYLCFDVRYT